MITIVISKSDIVTNVTVNTQGIRTAPDHTAHKQSHNWPGSGPGPSACRSLSLGPLSPGRLRAGRRRTCAGCQTKKRDGTALAVGRPLLTASWTVGWLGGEDTVSWNANSSWFSQISVPGWTAKSGFRQRRRFGLAALSHSKSVIEPLFYDIN